MKQKTRYSGFSVASQKFQHQNQYIYSQTTLSECINGAFAPAVCHFFRLFPFGPKAGGGKNTPNDFSMSSCGGYFV
jgi:hypothetical protein